MTRYLMVALGGAAGAVARYAVTLGVGMFWKKDFPLGTFLVNVSGCFILGLFLTMAVDRPSIGPGLRLLIATGFVGAYTTFSTFEYETQRLTSAGALGWGLMNVVSSVVAGYLAVVLGVALMRK
jgi:CrcB protein